jgi:hypothetical protein
MKRATCRTWVIRSSAIAYLLFSQYIWANNPWEVGVWEQYVAEAAAIDQSLAVNCPHANLTSIPECLKSQKELGRRARELVLSFSSFLSSTALVEDSLHSERSQSPSRFLTQVLLLELAEQIRVTLVDRNHPMVKDVKRSNEFSIAVQSVHKRSRSPERSRAWGLLEDLSFYPDETQIDTPLFMEARKFVNLLRLLSRTTETTRSCVDLGYDESTNLRSVYGLLSGSYFNSYKNAAPDLARDVAEGFFKVCRSFDSATDLEWTESVRHLRKFRAKLVSLSSKAN